MKINKPIGVFDSGVGGLTVLQALRQELPHEDFVYLGDTARLPYGTKSGTSVQRYTLEATRFLLKHDIKFLVLACNTVTAEALATATQVFPHIPIIGVIEPGAQAAINVSKSQRIGVLSTRATLLSKAYPSTIQQFAPNAEVYNFSAPLLVPLTEEGWLSGDLTAQIVMQYLEPVLEKSVDCLLLGCTHYPLLAPLIRKLLPEQIALVDSASTTAKATAEQLQKLSLHNTRERIGHVNYFVTDDPEQFARVGTVFLGHSIMPEKVTLVDL